MTYHAVTRYVQRVLMTVVDTSHDDLPQDPATLNLYLAKRHCDAIGRTVDDIRDEILTPAVLAACTGGFTTFRRGNIRFRIVGDGIIASVVVRPRRRSGLKLPKPKSDDEPDTPPKKCRRHVAARRHRFRSR